MMYKRTYVSGCEMTHKEFAEYVKNYKSLFENQTKILEGFEIGGDLLSVSFCVHYAALLEDRLRYCHTCSEYYRAMAEKSFWFMKRIVLRRAIAFEAIHRETLERLIIVRMFIKQSRYAKEETK